MHKIKSIYSKYDSEIVSSQYRIFCPESNVELNSVNRETVFKLHLVNQFFGSNIKYHIAGKYIPKDTTKTYGVNDGIMMIDNFVAHLFSNIEVKKKNMRIDECEEPGIVSTVIGLASFPGPGKYNGDAINSGFNSKMIGGGNFSACGKLGDLGLGFFSDTNSIHNGYFEIKFVRNSDNNVLYRYKDPSNPNSTEAVEGKVEIKKFYLLIPLLEYKDAYKLYNEIKTVPYPYHFKNFQCINSVVTGDDLFLDITNNYRNTTNPPIWGFVVFQSARKDDQKKDNSKFDHLNVKNISFEVSYKHYPCEHLNLYRSSWDFSLAYNMYTDFKRVLYKDSSLPYCDPQSFKESYPIFSVDMTRQPSRKTSNIILRTDFENKVPENTFVYVILVSEVTLKDIR